MVIFVTVIKTYELWQKLIWTFPGTRHGLRQNRSRPDITLPYRLLFQDVLCRICRLCLEHSCKPVPVHLNKISVRDHSLCECDLDLFSNLYPPIYSTVPMSHIPSHLARPIFQLYLVRCPSFR